jgi:MarR family transcriptional regulator, 2-MHQ and catechol-resistance regulon repressor
VCVRTMIWPTCRSAWVPTTWTSLLIYNLLRTHGYLAPYIDAGLREQDMTAAQFNALLALRAAGEEGLLMGDLGRRLMVTKSNVTGLVDRLERQGLVARAEHRDRRATVVRITAGRIDPAGSDRSASC